MINDDSYVSVSIPKNRKAWTEGTGDNIIVKIKTADVLRAMLEECNAPDVFKDVLKDVALCSNAAGIINYVVDYLKDKKAMKSFVKLHLDFVLKSLNNGKDDEQES